MRIAALSASYGLRTTRSYWQGLCREILGFDLHHEPTRGGQAEKQRFHEQYERTLAAYREAFGVAPPADIWPSAHVRFAHTGDFVRVNRRTSWVLPRPGAGGAALLAAAILPLALTACTESLADKGLLFWLKVALGAYAVYLFLKFLRWMGTGGWGGGGCGSACGGCGGGD